jgi:hypothetical protein
VFRRITVAVLAAGLAFAPTARATPVFDCTDPEVRREYPMQCPQLGVPGILGGSPGGGGGSCGALCHIGHLLHGLTGGLL